MKYFVSACCLTMGLLVNGVISNPAQAAYSPNPLDNAIMYTQQGTTLLKLGKYPEAVEYFQAAIRLNPYSAMTASIYNDLGVSYLKLKEYQLAIASFQHAFRIQPNYEIYYLNLINAYQACSGLSEAKAMLDETVEINPENAEAYYLLGLLSERLEDMSAARENFETFLKLKPNAYMVRAAKKHLKK